MTCKLAVDHTEVGFMYNIMTHYNKLGMVLWWTPRHIYSVIVENCKRMDFISIQMCTIVYTSRYRQKTTLVNNKYLYKK